MKAISVRQPWAALIVHGGKNVENRRRNIVGEHRGPIAIHASATLDSTAFEVHRRRINDIPVVATTPGAIVGVVDVIGVHRAGSDDCRRRCIPWGDDFDGVHIEVAWPRAVVPPVPCGGMLGLWTVEKDIEAAVVAQMEGGVE